MEYYKAPQKKYRLIVKNKKIKKIFQRCIKLP